VINIEEQNKALLHKNMHKFFNKDEIPSVQIVWEKHYANGRLPTSVKKGSFWWGDNLKNIQSFKQMAQIQVKSGITCLFWKDNWRAQSLEAEFPELFSSVKNKNISLASAWDHDDLTQLLHLPISEAAYNQLQQVTQETTGLQLSTEQEIWHYSWGNKFLSSRAYMILMGHSQHHPSIQWIWKSYCQPKHKVFFWLLLKDRLSTRNIFKRRNMTNHTAVFSVPKT